MSEKPKIQYVREFYNYGTEAKKLDLKSIRLPKTGLPLEKLSEAESISLDPVALIGILAAVVLLVVMAVGMMQIQDDWAEYDATSNYLSALHGENARLTREFQDGYDLEEIANKALGLGLVPMSEAKTMTVNVTLPVPEPEPTWQENLSAFWKGLWA